MDTIHIKGLDNLQRFLDQVPAKVERNIARGALRAAARTVLPVAQGNIRSISGELASSLKVSTRARGGQVTATVGTKVFYARFVEYGTKPHGIEPKNRQALSIAGHVVESVWHPGSAPRPFMRPALDSAAAAAVLAAAEYSKLRLATKHGLDTADLEFEVES